MAHKARRGGTILIEFSLYFIVFFITTCIYHHLSVSLSLLFFSTFDQASTVGDSSIISFSRQGHHGNYNNYYFYALNNYPCYPGIDYPLCSWPPRNAPVFSSLNNTLERCNDLLELVQTIEHFR